MQAQEEVSSYILLFCLLTHPRMITGETSDKRSPKHSGEITYNKTGKSLKKEKKLAMPQTGK